MKTSETKIGVSAWETAAAVVLPVVMVALDTSIVSVSLPHVAGSLSATTDEATWVQTSYLVANAIVLPASAWLSIFFGRKRFLIACIALFTFASFLCGAAPTLAILISARILQGAGGGALAPIAQSILLETFPPAKRGVAMATFSLGVIAAPVLGPLIGGWITDNYSWRWVFFINLPIGMAAIWMVKRFIVDPDYIRNARAGRIDAIGLGFLVLWLGTMQMVLDKGQEDDWFSALWVRWFSLICLASLAGFIIRELLTREPVVNLRVFADRNFAVGTVLLGLVGLVIYSPLTLLPLFLQNLMGYTALETGLAQNARGLGVFLLMPVVGVLVGKVDSRKLIALGFLVSGVAAYMLGLINFEVTEGKIAGTNFVLGLGLAMISVPLMTVAVARLRNEEMGNATGLCNLMRNLGGSIGISMVTTMVARGAQSHQAFLVTHLTPYDPSYQGAVLAAQSALTDRVGAAQAPGMALGAIYTSLVQQSTLLAYIDAFRWIAVLSFVAIPAVLLLKRAKPAGPVVVD
jgi:DHA2 family multidrug resistance protein